MLRQTALLLLFLSTSCLSFGQRVMLEKVFSDSRQLDKCIATEDGFLLLSHTQRRDPQAKPGNLSQLAYLRTQFLTKLAPNMEPLWEQSFPEAQLQPFSHLTLVPGGFLAFGTSSSKNDQAQLARFDHSGKQLWRQSYSLPGYQSSYAKSLTALPDGSAFLLMNVFKYEHSLLKTALLKVNAQGKVSWQKLNGKSDKAGGLQDLIVTRDNRLALAGTAYPDQGSWSRGNSQGWFLQLDPARSGQVVVDHRSPALPNFSIKGLVESEVGNFWAIGRSHGPLLMQLSPEGNPQKHIRIGGDQPFFPKDIALNPAKGTLLVAGISGTIDSKGKDLRKVRLMEVSQDWEIVHDLEYLEGEYLNMEVLASGQILLVSTKGIQIVG